MSRSIPTIAISRGLEDPYSALTMLEFLEITHPNLAGPIRVVSEEGTVTTRGGSICNYYKDGNLYLATPFGIALLSDDDTQPKTQLIVPNTDQRIGEAVLEINSPAMLSYRLVPETDYANAVDAANNARSPIGVVHEIYAFDDFLIRNVQCDVMQLTGDIQLVDYSSEPYPWKRATKIRLPGAFR